MEKNQKIKAVLFDLDNEEQKTNTLGTLGNGTGMDEVPCGAA